MKILKYLPTIFAKGLVNIAFRLCSIFFRINEKKVTFASYRAELLTGNLGFVYRELQLQKPDMECHFLFKKLKTTKLGKMDYLIHMVRASYHLATSRYFLIDDYYFPVYAIKPRTGMDIVQLWHAAGAFKKFGLSTVDKPFGPSSEYLKYIKVHSNYTKAIVSSTGVIPYYAEAFGMKTDKIFPLGVPRTDYFFDQDAHSVLKERFYQTFPKLKGKTLILYAPTFRGKSHYQTSFALPLDIKVLHQNLGNDYAILIHLHPYMRGDLEIKQEDSEFAYHIDGGFNIEELMVLSDMLLTDYSSVIFDYSLLCRPIAFIADDLEEYKLERDFYFPFETFIPGPFFSCTEELCQWVNREEYDLAKVEAFRDRFFDFHDGMSSYRIVHHLMGNSK
ncbi:CDP-glycerol glycerophosphotransferase family protein [Bacillus sp. FJAT-27251]|uniref:CDP-glycerol glycerophosphotransferase family protein n=1 Tax=Bacillus sp. FJAT-27251 TaxID=1684142 RepID=UPI0006A799FC|nr:CDP-glycerol glycerophosphotransferase family protein [Bacillus sp. FJAT-27251]